MARAMVNCTFCGDLDVPSSEEDAIPRWIVKKMGWAARQHHPDLAPEFVEHTYVDQESFEADISDQAIGTRSVGKNVRGAIPVCDKLPNVCETCNRGWMSRLENSTKQIIEGFFFGREKVIDPVDMFTLATWICKTCLAYDASYDDR